MIKPDQRLETPNFLDEVHIIGVLEVWPIIPQNRHIEILL